MAKHVYPAAKALALGAGIDWTGSTIRVAAVDGYTYSAAHEDVADLGATVVATSAPLTGLAISGAQALADATQPLAFDDVADDFTALVAFIDTGVAGTSTLLAYTDEGGDLPHVANGQDVDLLFTGGVVFTL